MAVPDLAWPRSFWSASSRHTDEKAGVTVVALAFLLLACGPPAPAEPDVAATPVIEPSSGLSFDEALSIAHEAAPEADGYRLTSADYKFWGPEQEHIGVPADRWTWTIVFRAMDGSGRGTVVQLDYVDGTVYSVLNGIE